MALLAVSAFYLLLAILAPTRSVQVVALGIGSAIWALCMLAFVALLCLEYFLSRYGCVRGSTTVDSRWTWLGPGVVCEYSAGSQGPSRLRLILSVSLLAIPLGTMWGLKRTKPRFQ